MAAPRYPLHTCPKCGLESRPQPPLKKAETCRVKCRPEK